MTALPEEAVVDSSVLLSFFRRDAGDDQPTCDRLLQAIIDGHVSLLLLDLSGYEFVNSLVRRHRVPGPDAAALVADLFELADHVVRVDAVLAGHAAGIAAATGLSAYDAAFAAAAELVAAPLITSDDRLADAAAAGVHLRTLR